VQAPCPVEVVPFAVYVAGGQDTRAPGEVSRPWSELDGCYDVSIRPGAPGPGRATGRRRTANVSALRGRCPGSGLVEHGDREDLVVLFFFSALLLTFYSSRYRS